MDSSRDLNGIVCQSRPFRNPTIPHNFEAGGLYERKARRCIVVAPVHWRIMVLLMVSGADRRPLHLKLGCCQPHWDLCEYAVWFF